MKKRYCKYCGKLLVRKKHKDVSTKRGWKWENLKRFKTRKHCGHRCQLLVSHKIAGHKIYKEGEIKRNCLLCGKEIKEKFPSTLKDRKYCNHSCGMLAMRLRQGCRLWTKKDIYSEFRKIKSKEKYNSDWLGENYGALKGAIQKHFKKNAWRKFLKTLDKEPGRDYVNPRKRRIAKKLLKYWRQEQDIEIGKVFEWADEWFIGIEGIKEARWVRHARKYLIEKKALKIYRKAKPNKTKGGLSYRQKDMIAEGRYSERKSFNKYKGNYGEYRDFKKIKVFSSSPGREVSKYILLKKRI